MIRANIVLFFCLHFLGEGLCKAGADTSSKDADLQFPSNTSETQTKPTLLLSRPTQNLSQTFGPTLPPCSPLLPTTTPEAKSFKMSYNTVLMVAGGLILVCFILLMSTLLLACKVCQLSRSVRMLSGHSDLMSTTKYWKESSEIKKNKSKTDAKETTVLMADLNQTRDETGDDGNEPDTENRKEEKETVSENGVEQKENCASNEETKETPAANHEA